MFRQDIVCGFVAMKMVKEMPSSTVVNRDEECLRKSLMEVVKSDSSNLCRLCLSKEQKLTRAFADERGIDDALLKKIFDCTTVKVKLKAIFPSAICAVCDLKLNEFYKFRQKCIENDTFLHTVGAAEAIGTTLPPTARNIVSSSSSASAQQHDLPTPSHLSTIAHVEQKKRQMEQERSFAMAALEMAGLQTLRTNTEPGGKFECTICHRMFRNAYTLRRHMNLHTETNLFPCEYCGKKFNDRSNWKIHQRTHTGDNLYTCLVCLKTFISPSTLKYHRRSHRRLESFDCRLCPCTFGSYDLLEEHARNSHQDMRDFQSAEEPMIDAASFVKIELEDEGDLSSSTAVGDVSTTQQHPPVKGIDEEEDRDRRRTVVDSSSVVDEMQLAELYRAQQEILELLEKDLQAGVIRATGGGEGAAGSTRDNAIGVQTRDVAADDKVEVREEEEEADFKREMLEEEHRQQQQQQQQQQRQASNVTIKEEPLDESMELDPSELLQQAMEEAADDGDEAEAGDDKQASSSSSSPSTVILFRCDYCMKIFHFLDELNAHMLLHNGAKGAAAGGGAIMLGTAATGPGDHDGGTAMPLLALMRSTGAVNSAIPLPSNGAVAGSKGKLSRKPKRRRTASDFMPIQAKQVRQGEADVAQTEMRTLPAPPEHPCSKCSKVFRTEELKRVHEETHANDEQTNKAAPEVASPSSTALNRTAAFRKCEICAIAFEDSVSLDKHMLCHFERKEAIAFVPQTDRPFQCTECEKSFKRKDYLLIHIRTHTGERRYKCDLCSSAFVHPSNLITHRKLHSSERPYQCTLCGSTFKLYAGLKIHRRRCEQKLPKNWPEGLLATTTSYGAAGGSADGGGGGNSVHDLHADDSGTPMANCNVSYPF
uniref:Protein krueppel n=1 Tax=Anopheles farauti TaxID=69004 RepID=A0A182Q561_9DIPT